MSADFWLGLATLLVAVATFVLQAAARRDEAAKRWSPAVFGGPYATIVFGVMPLVASMAFFGAWWMTGGSGPEVVVQGPLSPG